jgi:hypothetical protein
MKRTIERHIKEIESARKQVQDKRKYERDPDKRVVIDREIRATVAVISHYELALEIDGLPTLKKRPTSS